MGSSSIYSQLAPRPIFRAAHLPPPKPPNYTTSPYVAISSINNDPRLPEAVNDIIRGAPGAALGRIARQAEPLLTFYLDSLQIPSEIRRDTTITHPPSRTTLSSLSPDLPLKPTHKAFSHAKRAKLRPTLIISHFTIRLLFAPAAYFDPTHLRHRASPDRR